MNCALCANGKSHYLKKQGGKYWLYHFLLAISFHAVCQLDSVKAKLQLMKPVEPKRAISLIMHLRFHRYG